MSEIANQDLSTRNSTLVRMFGWSMLATMGAFLINNFLSNGIGMPGASLNFAADHGMISAAALQSLLYPFLIGVAIA